MQPNNNTTRIMRRYRWQASLAAATLYGLSGSAHAIPSPDLVINLSASVAQLLGLLSVVFGGFAVSANKRAKKKKTSSGFVSRILVSFAGIFLLSSLAINVLQYTSSIDDRNQRLHTNLVRKSVENGEAVGDVSLKTLSFSDQLTHSNGISTDTLAEWLAEGKNVNIIDVREDEEYEVGAIEGAAHLRYPDVLARSSLFAENTETLLLCYSGNRSSELCNELSAQGKSCNFMVGGYEKWLTESRPLVTGINITSDELRTLPDYANKGVLLDTPDVHALIAEESAEFIDVRYPGDFVKSHLPGAHNITMRALSSAALAERIEALPNTPLIAACYDKRSCFYSEVIGLRLERAGKDFRGRYTVPHEYYLAKSSDREHVSAWKLEQEQLTLVSYVVTPLKSLLAKLVDSTGHYALGLLAVVLMVRLLLMPLALKADRDTRVQKSLAARISAIKTDLADHPRALSEATLALYKRYRIRPIVNMLASLFQLGFMLLFYSAVNQSAAGWSQSFLWLESASLPDPLLILPVLASVLFVGVLVSQSRPETTRKKLLFALGGAALFLLLNQLGAAVNMYLTISMGFLIAQGWLFSAIGKQFGWDTLGKDKTGMITDTGLVPLSQAHYLPESTGKKAARLGEMIEAGFNVPDGFVFTSQITNRSRQNPHAALMTEAQEKQLDKLWKNLSAKRVAVRSSGANEDGEDNSFAGVYESILNITRDGLESAVREVYASLCSDRSTAYTQHANGSNNIDEDQGGVVVQKMVPAEYAGVMFTEHPATTGAMMVEMVTGLGEELVSGNVTPDTFAFGKISNELLEAESSDASLPPIDILPLLALGRELESLFGQPQDIEWAYANGKFYLLQTRDITRSIATGASLKNLAEQERKKLLGQLLGQRKKLRRSDVEQVNQPVFVQSELSELLPRPTPLSADFMERLWAAGGSTEIACQQLGIPYNVHYRSAPYINTIFGWLYVNKQEEQRRLGKGPGALASFRLSRDAESTIAQFHEEFLPRFQSEMIERGVIALERLTLESAVDMLDNWISRFIEDTYCEAERINISADFHMKTALDKLTAAKLEPALYLSDNEETVVSHAMSLLSGESISAKNIEEFLLIFGHRAPLDYELAEPRFDEDMNLVRQYIERSSAGHSSKSEHTCTELAGQPVLAITVQRARDFQRLKEEAKHYCLVELAQIRRLLLTIDKLCQLEGRIFQLTVDEILSLNNEGAKGYELKQLGALADQRFAASNAWRSMQLPSTLSICDLERIDMLTGKRPDAVEATDLTGKRVSGELAVTGRARVITDVSQIDTFKVGEILVARMTDPTWYPLFSQALGIVTEVGGWLSHAAIVAREYDLPAIVGVPGICQTIKTGDVITLALDGSIERVEERRAPTSPMRNSSADDDLKSTEIKAIGKAAGSNDYRLSSQKLFRFQKGIERRVMKERLGDRRLEPRHLASGEVIPDRRAANRAALRAENSAAILKKAS
ncbi:MAG: PEP/pyruvate-binding domain-containing protein [Granulosicoccus sp.]